MMNADNSCVPVVADVRQLYPESDNHQILIAAAFVSFSFFVFLGAGALPLCENCNQFNNKKLTYTLLTIKIANV